MTEEMYAMIEWTETQAAYVDAFMQTHDFIAPDIKSGLYADGGHYRTFVAISGDDYITLMNMQRNGFIVGHMITSSKVYLRIFGLRDMPFAKKIHQERKEAGL